MSLKHQLRSSRPGIPELDAAVLGSGQDPVGVGGQGNGQDKVSVAFKCLDTLALGARALRAAGRAQLPHLNRSIQTAADQVFAVGRESDGIDRVLVSIRSFQPLDQVACHDVPDANALVQRAGRNKLGVGGNGNSRNTVLDGEGEGVGALLNIPETDRSVATARGNGAAVARKVERVDVLFVAREVVADGSGSNIPHL